MAPAFDVFYYFTVRCNGHLTIIGERKRLDWPADTSCASLQTRTTTSRDETVAWVLVARVRTCFWVANCTSVRRRHVVTCGGTGAHTRGTEERVASPPCPYRENGGVYGLW